MAKRLTPTTWEAVKNAMATCAIAAPDVATVAARLAVATAFGRVGTVLKTTAEVAFSPAQIVVPISVRTV